MGNYVSLIVDIEKSKRYDIHDRNEIQQYMDRYIKDLNGLFSEGMQCEVMFSAGDELQGLFHDAVTALLYFRMLELLVHPVRIRAGIGVGDWTVKIEQGISTQQDGPAYHKARQAIDEVHDMQLHNIRICSDGDDLLANHFLNASYVLRKQQNYMQNIVQVLIELLFPFIKEDFGKPLPPLAKGDFGKPLPPLVKGDFRSDKYDFVKKIIADKFEYKPDARKGNLYARRNVVLEELPDVSPIYIDGKIMEPEKMIIKKNTAMTVSEILQCSRQNADTIMKRGNSYKIRELDYVALQYVEMNYGNVDESVVCGD